jgi:predicted RNA-binding protein with PUA-like domain
MPQWLVKSDPDDYGAHDLESDGSAVWDGVSNPQALQFLRQMKRGDRVLIYHTGDQKAVVATAKVKDGAAPDPGDKAGKLYVVGLSFEDWLNEPVTLAAIKADPAFADFLLVRNSRLSVMPVSDAEWKRIMKMAGH